MAMRRRQLVMAAPALLGLAACSTPAPPLAPAPPAAPAVPAAPHAPQRAVPWADEAPPPPGHVAVYVIPLDDFPEALAKHVAQGLQQAFGLRIQASPRLAPLRVPKLRGREQYAGEQLLMAARAASASLPGISYTTYRLFLTVHALGLGASGAGHFSVHNRELNSSVVSLAGLLEPGADKPVFTERTAWRLFKMCKRAVGELHLGWPRSVDPFDLMYAPITSVEDIDRMGLHHKGERPGGGPGGTQPQKAPAADGSEPVARAAARARFAVLRRPRAGRPA